MPRIYASIPNIAFHKIVKHYAFERGKPVFTLNQLDTAFINYLSYARQNN
jgi:hypothetical protein